MDLSFVSYVQEHWVIQFDTHLCIGNVGTASTEETKAAPTQETKAAPTKATPEKPPKKEKISADLGNGISFSVFVDKHYFSMT
jgi:hypothetical protein